MKKLILILLLVIISIVFYVYTTGFFNKRTSLISQTTEKQKLTFGVHPYLEKTHLHEKFEPFVKYLAKKLNKEVELQISPTYTEHIELVGKDTYDFSYIGPYSYINMVEKFGEKQILASMTTYDIPYFNGIIFVRENSSIFKINDIATKSFAFGKASSTMSSLVPTVMLKEAGVEKNNLGKYKHLNNHEEVVSKVLSGEFEAGAVKEAVFDKYKAKGLREVGRSRHIAEHVFVASNNLYPQTTQNIKKLLLTLTKNEEGKKILFNIKPKSRSLQSADDRNFNSLREYLDIRSRFKWDF